MKLKSMLTILLAIALVFSMGTSVCAAENDQCDDHIAVDEETVEAAMKDDVATANFHICGVNGWETVDAAFVAGAYKSRTATNCVKKVKTTYKCNDCNALRTESQYATNASPHIASTYDATCNGTYQTLYQWCYSCHYSLGTASKKCPAGPHTGGCSYLPA